ncbi:cytochrome P450 [Talaromyces proteolyticus]|uniref:Cytochrome P450 n=1 Tax=Talaromyces proteolyticus TaxID=1131652 RepID=A0AAD4L1Y2_9EURO|nr:cytochrome P450 [Talaromyces proteolyticus]KAH8704131.1 cytochrome P450 [Talaromyces proteolyticus]
MNTILQIIATLLLIPLYYYYFSKKNAPSLPPGPKPLPIIGNIADLPPKGVPEYQHWLRFKDKYGPISSVTVLGTRLIIIHDNKIAHDLLEKTSTKTSGRPIFHFAGALCKFDELVSFMQYNATFRQHRKLIHQHLGTKSGVARFRGVQDVESRQFLLRVLDDPDSLIQHIKTEASAIILQIVYGYSIEPRAPDPLVLLIERMMHNVSLAFIPLRWPVDFLPILKYLPERLPGMSFKSTARKWKKINRMVIDIPYAFVRQQMAKGINRPSYVASNLEPGNNALDENSTMNEDHENAIKTTAAIMYAGGADTTVSAICSLVLAMMLFPEVQRKAQQEIDAVVGMNRLPRFEDRENLTYVNALVKETLRWLPVTPTGVAHVADEEIICAGFRIPKGANLLPAVWWFLHDPSTYSDPYTFDPDRYLEPRNEPNPANEAFGYGRRICPGRHLADESLFLTVSRLLASFNITKAVDEQGKEIEPEVKPTPGLISRPLEFPYDIKPRSAKHIDLIRSVGVENPLKGGDAGLLTEDFTNECTRILKESGW